MRTATKIASGSIACHVTAVGASIPASFNVAHNSMNINKNREPTLTVKSVQFCGGLTNVGDSVYLSAVFAPSRGQNVTYSR